MHSHGEMGGKSSTKIICKTLRLMYKLNEVDLITDFYAGMSITGVVFEDFTPQKCFYLYVLLIFFSVYMIAT